MWLSLVFSSSLPVFCVRNFAMTFNTNKFRWLDVKNCHRLPQPDCLAQGRLRCLMLECPSKTSIWQGAPCGDRVKEVHTPCAVLGAGTMVWRKQRAYLRGAGSRASSNYFVFWNAHTNVHVMSVQGKFNENQTTKTMVIFTIKVPQFLNFQTTYSYFPKFFWILWLSKLLSRYTNYLKNSTAGLFSYPNPNLTISIIFYTFTIKMNLTSFHLSQYIKPFKKRLHR